jgi:hypothetical protein
MKQRLTVVDAYQRAMAAERALWESVKGKGPGEPGHDPEKWRSWLGAAGQKNAALKRLKKAFAAQLGGGNGSDVVIAASLERGGAREPRRPGVASEMNSRLKFTIGETFIDADGRWWAIQAAKRDGKGRTKTLRIKMAFPNPEKPTATFVMPPGEFMWLVNANAMRPVARERSTG